MYISLKRLYMNIINFILFFLLICVWTHYYNTKVVPQDWSYYVSIAAIILMVIQLYQLKILNIGMKDFIFWYITLQFIFYYGRIFVYAMGMDDLVPWKLFLMYSENIIFKASLFTLCYTQGVFLGVTLINNIKKQSSEYMEYKNKYYTSDILFKSGIFMFIITFPFELYKNIMTIIAQNGGEYIAVINISGIVASLGSVSIAGIIVMLASTKLNKKQAISLVSLYSIYQIIYMMLSGDRRQAITSFIVIGICIIKTYDIKLKPTIILATIIGIYFMFILLAAIRIVRLDGINIENVKLIMSELIKNGNLFVEIFGEFGSTFFTIVNAMTYYPSNYSFIGGQTYLASILIIIPGVFTYIFPNLFSNVTIPENLQSIDNNALGGSLGQDLYVNFGAYGIIGTVIIGVLLSKLTKRYSNSSLVDDCKYYIVFLILINIVRAGIYEVTRTLAISLILFELGCILCRKKVVRYTKSSLSI